MTSLKLTNFLLLVIAICLVGQLLKSNAVPVNAAVIAPTPVKVVSMPALDVKVHVTNSELPVKIEDIKSYISSPLPVEVKSR
jgi:hypothetical protein